MSIVHMAHTMYRLFCRISEVTSNNSPSTCALTADNFANKNVSRTSHTTLRLTMMNVSIKFIRTHLQQKRNRWIKYCKIIDQESFQGERIGMPFPLLKFNNAKMILRRVYNLTNFPGVISRGPRSDWTQTPISACLASVPCVPVIRNDRCHRQSLCIIHIRIHSAIQKGRVKGMDGWYSNSNRKNCVHRPPWLVCWRPVYAIGCRWSDVVDR